MAKATLAAGCFWGVESAFRKLDGVVATTVGYTGGSVADPTYELVCTGRTGHAEAIEIDYDPARISFEELLTQFWAIHDPTTPNRQGPDIGTQYRSAIFTHDGEQEAAARASLASEQSRQSQPIVTEIVAAGRFYPAEDYHQQYDEKRRGGRLFRF